MNEVLSRTAFVELTFLNNLLLPNSYIERHRRDQIRSLGEEDFIKVFQNTERKDKAQREAGNKFLNAMRKIGTETVEQMKKGNLEPKK